MASQVTSDDRKARAKKCYKGSKDLTEKSKKLLKLVGLPDGRILPDDIEEYGSEEETGFVWMKWKVKYEFKAIGRLVQYDTEIRGYKTESKELPEWTTISEISIDDRASAKISNKSISEGPSPTNKSAIGAIKTGSE